MVLSSWHGHCESSPGSFDECRLSAGWPPTLRPNQPIWAVSPPKDWLLPSADTIAIYYYYSARKLIVSEMNTTVCTTDSRTTHHVIGYNGCTRPDTVGYCSLKPSFREKTWCICHAVPHCVWPVITRAIDWRTCCEPVIDGQLYCSAHLPSTIRHSQHTFTVQCPAAVTLM